MKETHSRAFAPKYSVFDAFCGCGGLSYGFGMTGRFHALLGNDIKPEAVETFQHNHETLEGHRPGGLVEPIENLAPEDLRELMAHGKGDGGFRLDCLIGGPHCEGFSQNRTINGMGSRTHKFIDDPRNQLFQWFVRLAAALQPRLVLIENVPDLVRHRDGETREEIIAALGEAGYRAIVRVLNAADYGVPQMRRRAFFLCQRAEDFGRTGFQPEFPSPTHIPYPLQHSSLLDDPDWLPGDSGYWVSVREAIGDLPPPTESDNYDHTAIRYPEARLTTFRSLMRNPSAVPFNHLARKLGKGGLKRIRAIRPGQTCAELPDEVRPKSHYHYSYTRLSWSEPARTITKFAYHVGSGQFGHPVEDRAMTMREAARLQSFPDAFVLRGTNEIRKLSALVGSAVPPLLACAIGRQVAKYLDKLEVSNIRPDLRHEVKQLNGDAVLRRLQKEEWGTDAEPQAEQVTFLDR
jgi:DNA (cytosine-5)-methyltransferase 1